MNSLHENIKRIREEKGMTQDELAKRCGYISRSSITKIEKGQADIPQNKIKLIAAALGVSPAHLMGFGTGQDINGYQAHTKPKGVKIPVLGDVAAGVPIEAIEDILDYEEITQKMAAQGNHFGLRIKGDSMAPRMLEGDVVIVRQQTDIDSGDVAVIRINGEQVTVKRVKKETNGIILMPNNADFNSMFFSCAEIKKLPVDIIGKVVELRGKFL